MPPEATTTAWERSTKSPTTSRVVATPRAERSAARSRPATPSTFPAVVVSRVTRWRGASRTSPASTAARTCRAKGATTPGPVPHTMWKRGTEFPGPVASPPPRSAQPTTGKNRTPSECSQARFSPAAKST